MFKSINSVLSIIKGFLNRNDSLGLADNVLKNRVFKQDLLDLHIKEFMLGQTKPFLKKDQNVIDVGAATGMYSSFFAQHCKEVFSFEAVPPVFKQLELTAEKIKNINCYNLAVSDFEGKSDFFVDDKRLSNSSFSKLSQWKKIKVKTVKLDNFNIENIGFIKIDVEGVELDVLNGASDIFKEFEPTCMVEIYEKFNKYPVETTFDYFFKRSYSCFYNHKGKGLVQVKNLKEGKEAQKIPEITDGDFLFVKNKKI